MLRLHPDDMRMIARLVVLELRKIEKVADEIEFVCATKTIEEIKKLQRSKDKARGRGKP